MKKLPKAEMHTTNIFYQKPIHQGHHDVYWSKISSVENFAQNQREQQHHNQQENLFNSNLIIPNNSLYHPYNALLWQPWSDLHMQQQHCTKNAFPQETRLTAKELPTTDWRRKRRARTGEYVHGMGSNSPLNVLANASPPCSPGATIPTAVAHRVHFYPHVPATRYPALHYQSMPHHTVALHAAAAAAATAPLMLPAQTSVTALAGAANSSITSPSPSPTSSTSSLSQTSLLMAANLQQQSNSYVPQAHRSSQAAAAAAAAAAAVDMQDDDEQNLDCPLDMTVSSALLKQQRESPPPPYREPLPGSCYMAALARPSVITQAPPKRKEDIANNGDNDMMEGNEGVKSIVIKTEASATATAVDPTASSLCETVIDEHFRRSLGADYLALFAHKKQSTNDNNYYEQPAPLQLTTKSSPLSSPVPTTITPESLQIMQQQQQTLLVDTETTKTTTIQTQIEQPLTLVMPKVNTNIEATGAAETTTTTSTENIGETKRYGKHKIAYMQQKSNQYYQQQAETTELKARATPEAALSLIQPRLVTASSPQAQSQAQPQAQPQRLNIGGVVTVDGKKKTTTNSNNNNIVKVEPQASICDIVAAEENLNTSNTSPTSSSIATISEEASVDDHFAKALGDKWKELQTSKNLRK